MSYMVSATDLKAIRLSEADTVNAVLQNIAVILSTPKGTVPLYRDFGLDWTFLDKPMPVAKVMLISEVREAIERWESRAEVVNVYSTEDPAQPGTLIPTVEVNINIE
nr:MAG TPA: baseplate assembly protein [Caudoviricetes sp.]